MIADLMILPHFATPGKQNFTRLSCAALVCILPVICAGGSGKAAFHGFYKTVLTNQIRRGNGGPAAALIYFFGGCRIASSSSPV